MRKPLIPALFLLLGLLIVGGAMVPRGGSDFALQSFAALPVQSGGRVLPVDSVARNSLRILQGRQSVRLDDGAKLEAVAWLLDLCYRPEQADAYPVFRIDNPDVLGLFGWEQDERKYFSWNELEPHFDAIYAQAQRVPEKAELRTSFHQAVVKLARGLTLYNQLAHSLAPGGDYALWPEVIGPGRAAFAQYERGEPFDEAALEPFMVLTDHYLRLANTADLGVAPAEVGEDWLNIGEAMLAAIGTGKLGSAPRGYGALGAAWRDGDAAAFNGAVEELRAALAPDYDHGRVAFERFFNQFQPFYQASVLYVLIFALVCVSWLKWTEPLQRAAFWLLLLALAVHTFGLFARMYIQERPPVTNLYSSAIFVGWVAILTGVALEWFYRNGIGSFVAALIGFATLVIAHNLALTGDTLEMMQAVLDSNFWLATHVVIITAGYGAVFLAGALGLLYVLRGTLTASLDSGTARALYRMAYGVTCFGLLFSFVGTMLGGVWADQSWGRFWGWDPKENGALLIVLWGALMLHARWGGLCRERGFMLLAIGGNIVTAWSWFGTNMLGIGLHSYGFMDQAFVWLMVFWVSQLLVIAIGLLPSKHWASNRQPPS